MQERRGNGLKELNVRLGCDCCGVGLDERDGEREAIDRK
jgi:hypothetical protein